DRAANPVSVCDSIRARNRRLDHLALQVRQREELAMLVEQKPRRKDQAGRRGENLARPRTALGLCAPRHVPRLQQTTVTAIEVVRVKTEAIHRLLDQMGTRAEEREVMDANNDRDT